MRQILNSSLFLMAIIPSLGVVSAADFFVELESPLKQLSSTPSDQHGVSLEKTFAAGENSYALFSANSEDSLQAFLSAAAIEVEKISLVLFVNSPTVAGGQPAGEQPRDGHGVFVIERPIPGVGYFGLDKKKKISNGSNAAIKKLGDIIEWDQSYLTSEGTYCVYRADSPETLRKHGALAGAPIGKITLVDQKTH